MLVIASLGVCFVRVDAEIAHNTAQLVTNIALQILKCGLVVCSSSSERELRIQLLREPAWCWHFNLL